MSTGSSLLAAAGSVALYMQALVLSGADPSLLPPPPQYLPVPAGENSRSGRVPPEAQYSIYDASASSSMDEFDGAQCTEEQWRVWNQQQQQQQWPDRMAAAEPRPPPQSLPPPTSLLLVASAGPSVAPPARDEQPPRAPVAASASSLPAVVSGGSVDDVAMFAVCEQFLQKHVVQGPSPLMAHEEHNCLLLRALRQSISIIFSWIGPGYKPQMHRVPCCAASDFLKTPLPCRKYWGAQCCLFCI